MNKKFVGVAITFVVLVLIVVVLLFDFRSTPKDPIPPTIATLSLQQKVIGNDAERIINQLHGKGVTAQENAVGFYQSGEERATVYYTRFSSASLADSSYHLMARRIQNSRMFFTDFNVIAIGDVPVSVCLGQGQAHYFFAYGDRVYWLAADVPQASTAAASLVAYVSD